MTRTQRRIAIFASDYGRDAGWDVFRGDTWQLSLVDVRREDMFWHSYRLDPPTSAATRLEFWELGDIVVRSKLTGEVARGWFVTRNGAADRMTFRALLLDPGWPGWPWPWERDRAPRMRHEVPEQFHSTLAMFECAFGAEHELSAREVMACITIMAAEGMSDRSVATVVALLRKRPASDYVYHLQLVSRARTQPTEPVLVRELFARLQQCGYAQWQRED